MDPTADTEPTDPSEARSKGLAGEKRPVENGEDGELAVRKKARGGGLVGDMKRVAEIVLVLSAMGTIRGGRNPTAAEKALMEEARAKLAEVCQGLAPKDILPMEAVGTVMEDLGLNNKSRDQRLGFRPPKMSIAEKLLLTKRRMEKSKEFAANSASYSSQLQTSFGAVAENRGTSHTARLFPSDKPSLAPISSGGFQPAAPLGHVSAAPSTSLPYQLPTKEVRSSVVSSGLPASHLGKDSSSLALPRIERAHFRLDGRSNGSSYASQVRAHSSGDHSQAKTPTWSLQPQSAASAKIGPQNKVPDDTFAKVEGTADLSMSRMAPQAIRDQTSKPFITQTTSGNLPSIHQPLQGMNFVQAPAFGNNHNEIAKIVQKLYQPQLPEHPTWTPPSRDYMNKVLTCQICKVTINDVESVLVCDACEKGFHLKCLQSYNQKGIPRGEWHCAKCLTLSSGKPLPPKYGRVTRNINPPKVSSNTGGVQSSEKKVGTLDQKVNQQKITANGNSGLQSFHTATVGSNNIESGSNSKIPNAREMQRNNFLTSREKMDDKPYSGTYLNNSTKALGIACVSPSIGSSIERSCEGKSVSESKSQPLAESFLQVVDQTGLPNCAEVQSKQCPDNNPVVKDSEKFHIRETFECNPSYDIKRDDQDVAQTSSVGTCGTSIGGTEHARFSSAGLHGVDWIGDVFQVVDGKSFYQSCCINGITYKVQDRALFRSSNDKLIPSKLQAMWEDSKSRSKWVIVNRCYFPGDLPDVVGRPCTPASNEVYESNHDSTIMAGLIQGPCEVLPPDKFKEENERRTCLGTEANDGLRPVFLCKWFYDESKGLFRAVSS